MAKRNRALRFAILDVEDAQKWLGYTEKLWREAFAELPDDSFEVFACYQNQFPDPKDVLSKFDVLILGGSHYSAYEDIPWIKTLEEKLREYMKLNVRLIACCFGHQILAKALGGTVGKNPSGRFVLGLERVRLESDKLKALGLCDFADAGFGHLNAAPDASDSCIFNLVESHGDQVLDIPPEASVLGSSETAKYEMLSYGDRVVSFQFHPEMPPQLAYDKIWTALSASGRLDDQEARAAQDLLLHGRADAPAALSLLYRFAEGAAPPPRPRLADTVAAGPEDGGG